MIDRLRFLIHRIREKLWIRPLGMCVLSTITVFLAKTADNYEIDQFVPEITTDSIETLLTTVASSMLVIATFAVGSMVSAYASAGNNATPRSFPLVIADDVSQNALSTFIGAFIYSIIALIALQNGYYNQAGRFAIFSLTLIILTMVIVTFVRWVDSIARLGRLGGIIDKVETATADALQRRRSMPTLLGIPAGEQQRKGQAIYGDSIGYVQRIGVNSLQAYSEKLQLRITVASLPGTFSAPGRPLAYVTADRGDLSKMDSEQIVKAFYIGDDRKFDEDPRFGLIVLSEIASRALSPSVNDPGTAIDIIGTFVRLFTLLSSPIEEEKLRIHECDRVEVPQLSLQDMFDDAFTGIARDGAGAIEVVERLQKAFAALATIGDARVRDVAMKHAQLALARSERALKIPEDIAIARKAANLVGTDG